MTKKYYAQPEMMVVNVKSNDIITDSIPTNNNPQNGLVGNAPGQRGLFDSDDSWANAGY